MKGNAPWGENLLRYFFTSDDFEQEALGDLFEEWNVHIREAGLLRANIGYLRQVVSLIPHLLRCWVHRVDRFEAVKTASLVAVLFAVVGYVTVLDHATNLTVINFGLAMLGAGSSGPNTNPIFVDWVGVALSVSAISTVYAIAGGVAAGAVGGRASMIAVVWLSLIWAVASPLYVLSSMPDQWPGWYLATYPVSMVAGTIAGGCIAVLLRAHLAIWRRRRTA